ncbi:hypothetical protein Gogos_019943 [Gossypium gossypioides]|uniref:PPM-type phosphatase domain-containing protein n=1 Tax=Gossypium gossypioides TaxID=34282 RepID=A0A7J9D1I8_GOSGO|nr:hypothetical protein [Gossypium gossypioides]
MVLKEHSHNLQWAHGKAGEDRVHVVLSKKQRWLFIVIFDGSSGPDAPDFLMSHLYKAIDKELEGLLWDYEPETSINGNPNIGLECNKENWEIYFNNEISKDNDDVRGNNERNLCNCRKSSLGVEPESVPLVNFAGRAKEMVHTYNVVILQLQEKMVVLQLLLWFQTKDRAQESLRLRCKSGVVDHDVVLQAMVQVLESTEEAYMEMVEKAFDVNPKLALMGSCILVMLTNDHDVYVMNLRNNHVILA